MVASAWEGVRERGTACGNEGSWSDRRARAYGNVGSWSEHHARAYGNEASWSEHHARAYGNEGSWSEHVGTWKFHEGPWSLAHHPFIRTLYLVIASFADATTADIFHGDETKAARAIPKAIWPVVWTSGVASDVQVTDYH